MIIMKSIKLKLSKMSNIYLMTLYMKILDVCLMNQMGFYLMRLNLMELNLMGLNIMRLDLMKLNLMRLIILILNPIRLIKYNEARSNEIDYIDSKPHEIKSYEPIFNNIESNEDYCIENIKNKFNKLSNNLVEANTKDIRYIVDHINNGENLKETLINLEDIRDKLIAYNDTLPFGILSKSSYIDLRKMNIISSVKFDDEYKILKTKSRMMVKSLKALKMSLFLRFLKYISKEELSEEKLSEYIELNKNKVQNVWIDKFKKWLKELRDTIDQKYMIKRELRMKRKELKSEKLKKIDLLEWKIRTEKLSMKDNDEDEYFQHVKLDEIKEE